MEDEQTIDWSTAAWRVDASATAPEQLRDLLTQLPQQSALQLATSVGDTVTIADLRDGQDETLRELLSFDFMRDLDEVLFLTISMPASAVRDLGCDPVDYMLDADPEDEELDEYRQVMRLVNAYERDPEVVVPVVLGPSMYDSEEITVYDGLHRLSAARQARPDAVLVHLPVLAR